ncbi:MAG TPA: DMT family transporter, partial [Caulifigura sp.]|nr:DMT family transporter [Caulifigura sp.]
SSSVRNPADERRRTAHIGLAFGIGAALAYTWTNILLRNAAGPTDLGWNCWVTCLKAVPSACAAWALIIYRWSRGERGLDGWRSFLWLTLNGFFMQFGGNIAFQYAMSFGGLALTVPMCFCTLILSGALGGRLFLKEKISRRAMVAMWLLITAVIILSQGADEAAHSMRDQATFADMLKAIVFSGLSGLGYGFGGVSIRHAVTGTGTIASTIAPLSTIGIIGPGLIAWNQMGPAGLAAVPWRMNAILLTAGTFNAIGFFFVSAAMARMPLVRVNLVNASQTAMCALGGILFYREPATWWIGLGTAFTILSLGILGTQDPHSPDADTALIMDAEQPQPPESFAEGAAIGENALAP